MLDLQSSGIDIEKNRHVNTLVKYLVSSRDLLEENTKLMKSKMDTTVKTLDSIIKQISDKVLSSHFNYYGFNTSFNSDNFPNQESYSQTSQANNFIDGSSRIFNMPNNFQPKNSRHGKGVPISQLSD